MSTEPEQIEIDIDAAEKTEKEPVKEEIEVVKAEEAPAASEKKVIPPEEGLEEFKKRFELERKARIDAEKRAQVAALDAHKAKGEVHDTNLQLVANAIDTINQQNEILKSHYSAAMSSGDFDRAAEIQNNMSSNNAKLVSLEQGKTALENTPKPPPPRPAPPADPVEAIASQLSPRSAEWIRQHPEYARDRRLFQKMIAAHNLISADGVAPDSDEYFSGVERVLNIRPQEQVRNDDAMADSAKVTQRRSGPPAAPVSRSGTGTGSRPNVVRLTAEEREMASAMKMTDQEYAKAKLALQKEGKLN
jgi:hypothetical protein